MNPASLSSNAPEISEPPRFTVTGNLAVSVPEISLDTGAIHRIGILTDRHAGLLEAHGTAEDPLVELVVLVDGRPQRLTDLVITHDASWIPRLRASTACGQLTGWVCAPPGESGLALRLELLNDTDEPAHVELGWAGLWAHTSLSQFRAKPVDGQIAIFDDRWTGSRVATLTCGVPTMALAWRDGADQSLTPDPPNIIEASWRSVRALTVLPGATAAAELFLAVAVEPDGASTTALHLRRRGFADLYTATVNWLSDHAMRLQRGVAVDNVVNRQLFFNYFFAQGDCIDTGRPVVITSRSPHYYVSAAFWSRDAYCWTYPALLIADPQRARDVLMASLAAAGRNVAEHALYLNGTRLYPGFELDQAAAPMIAVARYLRATQDFTVLHEEPIMELVSSMDGLLAPWFNTHLGLYGTFLLPTDDPTEYPYTATGNAIVAAAFDDLAYVSSLVGDTETAGAWRQRAQLLRAAIRTHLTSVEPGGIRWVWGCDASGKLQHADEPPLGLRTLPYWGLCDMDDPIQIATCKWLIDGYPHHYAGRYGGAGAEHFPHPSGFDLANRLVTLNHDLGDPLQGLAETPMDQGLACESWDPQTGVVATGAAMASMAGFLAWSAWAHVHRLTRWDQPLMNHRRGDE